METQAFMIHGAQCEESLIHIAESIFPRPYCRCNFVTLLHVLITNFKTNYEL